MLNKLKCFIVKLKIKRKHPKVSIKSNCYFDYYSKIKFEGFCFINSNCYWDARGGIQIGDNVIFGPFSKILTANHLYESNFIPYGFGFEYRPVIIEDNVWIGANVLILPGVKIMQGAIVGAGSVVTKDVQPLEIVGGNPAKKIGFRNEKNFFENFKEKRFYLRSKKS